jgi:hypothetical protein
LILVALLETLKDRGLKTLIFVGEVPKQNKFSNQNKSPFILI